MKYLGDITFNPLTVKNKDGNLSLFMGLKIIVLLAPFFDKFTTGDIPNHVLDTLPTNKQSLLRERKIFHLIPIGFLCFITRRTIGDSGHP